MTTTLRRPQGASKAAAGMLAGAGHAGAMNEGAATIGDAGSWEARKQRDSASPSLLDGFNGAADARHLEWYAGQLTSREELARGVVFVQCTRQTRELLRRAGHKRCMMHDPYEVRVVRDRFNRLQLAPQEKGVAA